MILKEKLLILRYIDEQVLSFFFNTNVYIKFQLSDFNMALTEMQEGDLIVKKESNYTIEKLTDDFRHWVSKRLNGSVGSFVKEIGLGYELIFGVGYRD